MSPRHLIGMLLVTGLLAACNNGSGLSDFGNTNIANGGIKVSHGEVTLHADGAPDAVIGADGAFNVDGKPVPTSEPQRELLKHYYAAAAAVREHGIATGKAGVALAGESIKGAVASIASGDDSKADQQAEAGSQKVTEAAMKICQDLVDIKAAQDGLASQLVAFKPYAGILTADAGDDCRKDDDK